MIGFEHMEAYSESPIPRVAREETLAVLMSMGLVIDFANYTNVLAITGAEDRYSFGGSELQYVSDNEAIDRLLNERMKIGGGSPDDRAQEYAMWEALLSSEAWWINAPKQSFNCGLIGQHVKTWEPHDLFKFYPWYGLRELLLVNSAMQQLDDMAIRRMSKFARLLVDNAPVQFREGVNRIVFLDPIELDKEIRMNQFEQNKILYVDARLLQTGRDDEVEEWELIGDFVRNSMNRMYGDTAGLDAVPPEIPEDLPPEHASFQRIGFGPKSATLQRSLPVPRRVRL